MVDFINWLNARKGNQAALARHLNITTASITQWGWRGSIPPLQVRKVAEFTDIPVDVLAPELYGDA